MARTVKIVARLGQHLRADLERRRVWDNFSASAVMRGESRRLTEAEIRKWAGRWWCDCTDRLLRDDFHARAKARHAERQIGTLIPEFAEAFIASLDADLRDHRRAKRWSMETLPQIPNPARPANENPARSVRARG